MAIQQLRSTRTGSPPRLVDSSWMANMLVQRESLRIFHGFYSLTHNLLLLMLMILLVQAPRFQAKYLQSHMLNLAMTLAIMELSTNHDGQQDCPNMTTSKTIDKS